MIDIDSVRQSGLTMYPAAQAVSRLLDESGFIRSAWGKRHAVGRSADLSHWLPTATELLGTPLLRPPYAVVLSGGKPIAREHYCRSAKVLMGGAPEQVPGEVRTSIVKGIYDNLDRSDGTEISPENLPGILDDVCQSLGMMVEQLSALAKSNPRKIELQAISEMFGNLRD